MKILFQIFTILIICSTGYSQSEIPTKKDMKKAKVDTNINIYKLINEHKQWKPIAIHEYRGNKYRVLDTSNQVVFIDTNRVNFVTPSDKLQIKNKLEFEIIYGGSGPERQTYQVLSYDGDYLILESKYTNKGYMNGKLAWKQKNRTRYVWRAED